MAISFRRHKSGETTGPPRAVMAAAMPLSGPDVIRVSNMRRMETQEGWQKEAWYYYDAVGELRSPVNWIANAVSQASVFGAEIDPDTGLVTGPTENTDAQRAAVACLGGTAKRAQLQYILAVCWQIPGEAFIVIRPTASRAGQLQPDEWIVLSGTKVKVKGEVWTYTDPVTGADVTLGSRDRLLRVWSPHPNDQAKADTAVRPALPVLREIEKSSMNIASRLDSRLASNGILPFPQEANFPTADGMNVAQSVTAALVEAMEAAMSNPGTAAGQVPIVVEMPIDMIQQWKDSHMDLSTDFDASIVELRNNDLGRLAATLDMPKDVAAGTQGESNHWSAWQVEESTYKIYIEPLLQRIGDALTEYWYRPVLRLMGVSDPERYVLDWDTTAIVKRPDATEDLNWLYERRLISDDYRRAESGVPDDAVPSEEELQRRLLVDVVTGAPTLAADPTIGQQLFGFEVAPAAAGVSSAEIGGAPALEAPADGSRALPATQNEEPVPDGLVAAAEVIVVNALSRAGSRLLTRETRAQFSHVDKHELHTVIKATDTGGLLHGSFTNTNGVADAFGRDRSLFRTQLLEYSRELLTRGVAYDRVDLAAVLRAAVRP